jgi:hypothetical protein
MTEKRATYEPQFLVAIEKALDTASFVTPRSGGTVFTNPHRVTIRCGEHSFTLRLRPEGLLVSTRDGFLGIQPKAGNSVLLREI